jgi:hypothetical protein
MSTFAEIQKDIQLGVSGESISIPLGLDKLSKYGAIREKIMQLVFSSTGAGKSSFVDTAYILNPYDWLLSNQNTSNVEMHTILFSMERAKKYRMAKWLVRKIFIDYGVKIPLPKLFGWWREKLSKEDTDLIELYEDYINELESRIDIFEGPRSPADIYRIVKEYTEKNGVYEQISEHKKVYIPNNRKKILNIILDHGNLTKTTKNYPNKKQAIDANCEQMQGFRDLESAHVVWVAQVNRDASNPFRQKELDMELTLDDVKASGDVGDACDIGISLFDPLKYKQGSKTGYNPVDFVDSDGSKFFRSVTICKSSYGADDVRIPLAFNGFCGDFKELPRKADVGSDYDYQQLIKHVKTGGYFFNT